MMNLPEETEGPTAPDEFDTFISKEATMLLLKFLIVSGLIAIGVLSVEATDLEMKVVDKNCWIEVFDDSKYDAKNPHLKLQGPKEYPTLKNIEGKDWNNEIESVIVGPSATVRAYKDRDFQGPEIAFAPGQRIPKLSKLDMSNEIESMKIMCEKSDLQSQPSSGPSSSTSTTTTTTTITPTQ
jgi:hypothetical protein